MHHSSKTAFHFPQKTQLRQGRPWTARESSPLWIPFDNAMCIGGSENAHISQVGENGVLGCGWW